MLSLVITHLVIGERKVIDLQIEIDVAKGIQDLNFMNGLFQVLVDDVGFLKGSDGIIELAQAPFSDANEIMTRTNAGWILGIKGQD